jgi:hypothetical protein
VNGFQRTHSKFAVLASRKHGFLLGIAVVCVRKSTFVLVAKRQLFIYAEPKLTTYAGMQLKLLNPRPDKVSGTFSVKSIVAKRAYQRSRKRFYTWHLTIEEIIILTRARSKLYFCSIRSDIHYFVSLQVYKILFITYTQ